MKLHDYQEYAVKFIEEHKIAALLLDICLLYTSDAADE